MKTKEELTTLKEEIEAVNKKLAELSDEELEQVVGGSFAQQYGEQNGGLTDYLDSAYGDKYYSDKPEPTGSW